MQNGIKKKRKSFECVLFAVCFVTKCVFKKDYNRDKQTNEQKTDKHNQTLYTKAKLGNFDILKQFNGFGN